MPKGLRRSGCDRPPLRLFLADAALLRRAREHFADEPARFLRGPGPRIRHEHVHAAGGCDLHDSSPHGAGADYTHDEVWAMSVEWHVPPMFFQPTRRSR